MTKGRANKSVIILSSILSFIVGFVFSAFTVFYLSIPESYIIPDTYIIENTYINENNNTSVNYENNTEAGTIVVNHLDTDKITNEDLSIHFLELGNKYTGDCTLIKVGDTEILIDAGSRTSSVPIIQNYLDQYVTDHTLEYVIVTHAHQDHIAGFGTPKNTDSLFDLYNVSTVIQFAKHNTNSNVYKNYCRELEDLQARCGTTVYTALQCVDPTDAAPQIYDLSANNKLEILDQDYYHTTSSDENNYSVCCQIIQNNEKYYLFTGDLEKEGEASLIARNLNRLYPVELFKAGHHGSKTSSTDTLLSVIQPKIVCVCCCAGSSEYTSTNVNQFPTQDFIDRIAPYTDQVFVTTLCVDYQNGAITPMNGNIVVYYSREEEIVTVACSNNTIILKDTDWFKANRTIPNAWIK